MTLDKNLPTYALGEDFYYMIDVGEDISDSGWDVWAGLFKSLEDAYAQGIGNKVFSTSAYITKFDVTNGLFLVRFHRTETAGQQPGIYYVCTRVDKPGVGQLNMPVKEVRLIDHPFEVLP